jgi:glycerate kinase
MHILIAPNAFKNSLAAGKVAEAIGNGLRRSKLSCTITSFPVADGGDGTAALLVEHLQGRWIPSMVHDPLGKKISSSYGLANNDQLAIIELADASGLRLLTKEEYDPLRATTFGTGELISHALDKKVDQIILCIGGSATVDGGAGILHALGVKFFDEKGKELDGSPASLLTLSVIDTTQLDRRLQNIKLDILCDVENFLLGPAGAPAVFGPQKGATPESVKLLDTSLAKFRDIALLKTGKDMGTIKHGGASGGVAAGLYAFLNASLVNGIDHFLQVTGFEKELAKAHIVITGEGSIDAQTLQGKGPFGVAKKAKEHAVTVIGMAGKITTDKELQLYFDKLISINEQEQAENAEDLIKNTFINLERTAMNLGNLLADGQFYSGNQ